MPDVNLSTILPERKSGPDSFPAEYLEMQSARRAFLRAWAAWLRTGPSQSDMHEEAYASASAHRQITDLSWLPTPRPQQTRPQRRRGR